jgi:hypothetical protein
MISSLSQNSGSTGTQVMVNGSGFTPTGNSVNLGNGTIISNLTSGGISLTFTMPGSLGSGLYNITVTNANGTSNSAAFTVTAANVANCQPTQCATPPLALGCSIVGAGTCVNGVISCGTLSCTAYPPLSAAPVVSSLLPDSGPVGSILKIVGSGFVSSGNAVHFQILTFANGMLDNGSLPTTFVDSNDLTLSIPLSVSKTGPSSEMPVATQLIPGTTYYLFVTNSNGSSNAKPFTVSSPPIIGCQPSQCGAAPAGCNYVGGGQCINGVISCGTLTCPSACQGTINDCPQPQQGCNFVGQGACVNGVISCGTLVCHASAPIISSLSPTVGSFGIPITVNGSGFTPSGNTVSFDAINEGLNLASNGTSLTFNVPSQTPPGSYSLTVSNANGTSNSMPFTVACQGTINDCPQPQQGCNFVGQGACVNGVISCGTLVCHAPGCQCAVPPSNCTYANGGQCVNGSSNDCGPLACM